MIAANARIGVAKAQFFPTISLTAVLGNASSAMGNLFRGSAQTHWSYGGTVSPPIFTGGEFVEPVAGDRSAAENGIAAVSKIHPDGHSRKWNDSLIDQTKTREQLAAQARQVASLRDYARLARLRYDNGFTSYLEVTDARRPSCSTPTCTTPNRRGSCSSR